MRILDRIGLRKLATPIVTLILLLLSGCAGAPIQEMSDARQAISVARGEPDRSAENRLQQAELLLQRAEELLRNGDYSEARRLAAQAKLMAISARQSAREMPPTE